MGQCFCPICRPSLRLRLLWCLYIRCVLPHKHANTQWLSGNWTAEVGWRAGTEINTWWRPCHCSVPLVHSQTYAKSGISRLYALTSGVIGDMAGFLCGTKRKKQGKVGLILGCGELAVVNGEAGPVTFMLCMFISTSIQFTEVYKYHFMRYTCFIQLTQYFLFEPFE